MLAICSAQHVPFSDNSPTRCRWPLGDLMRNRPLPLTFGFGRRRQISHKVVPREHSDFGNNSKYFINRHRHMAGSVNLRNSHGTKRNRISFWSDFPLCSLPDLVHWLTGPPSQEENCGHFGGLRAASVDEFIACNGDDDSLRAPGCPPDQAILCENPRQDRAKRSFDLTATPGIAIERITAVSKVNLRMQRRDTIGQPGHAWRLPVKQRP